MLGKVRKEEKENIWKGVERVEKVRKRGRKEGKENIYEEKIGREVKVEEKIKRRKSKFKETFGK